MATLQQLRSFGASRLVVRISQGYAGLITRIAELLGAKQISVLRLDPVAAERAAQLFAQARDEDSNLELDWLWYAAKMTSSAHKRYCLRRALEINPHSEMARSELAKLALCENR
jgi:hypothetical protein